MNEPNLPPGVKRTGIEWTSGGISADMIGDARCEIPEVMAEFGRAVQEMINASRNWDYDDKPELAVRSARIASAGLRKTARMLNDMASTIEEWRGYAQEEAERFAVITEARPAKP